MLGKLTTNSYHFSLGLFLDVFRFKYKGNFPVQQLTALPELLLEFGCFIF